LENVAVVAGLAFPPSNTANTHRILAWTRYLPEYGWNPIVLTLPVDYRPESERDMTLLERIPPTTEIRRLAPLLFTRLPRNKLMYASIDGAHASESRLSLRQEAWRRLARLKSSILLPDTRLLWVPVALREISRLFSDRQIQILVSTSRENSSHLVGLLARSRIGIPWIADFQDPWESPWHGPSSGIQATIHRKLGESVARRATHFIATSWSIRRQLIDYGADAQSISLITNGFDPLPESAIRSRPHSGESVTIVHTGRFYGRRTPKSFLKAVSQLVRRREGLATRLRVLLVGDIHIQSAAEIRPFAEEKWLRFMPSVPHEEALSLQMTADVLLLIPGEESLSVPGKAFEYIRTGRPILALCSEESDTGQLLKRVGSGVLAPPDDVRSITRAFEQVLGLGTGTSKSPGLDRRALQYAWKQVVGELAGVLDHVSAPHHRGTPSH